MNHILTIIIHILTVFIIIYGCVVFIFCPGWADQSIDPRPLGIQEGLAVSLLLNMSGRKQSGPKALRRGNGGSGFFLIGQCEVDDHVRRYFRCWKLGFEMISLKLLSCTAAIKPPIFAGQKTGSCAAWATFSCWYNTIFGWWFGTFFIFPYIGLLIIPIDELIFFRGWLNHQPVLVG